MTDALLALAFAPFFVMCAALVIDDMTVMMRRGARAEAAAAAGGGAMIKHSEVWSAFLLVAAFAAAVFGFVAWVAS